MKKKKLGQKEVFQQLLWAFLSTHCTALYVRSSIATHGQGRFLFFFWLPSCIDFYRRRLHESKLATVQHISRLKMAAAFEKATSYDPSWLGCNRRQHEKKQLLGTVAPPIWPSKSKPWSTGSQPSQVGLEGTEPL